MQRCAAMIEGISGGSLLKTTVQQLESDLRHLTSNLDDVSSKLNGVCDEFTYYEGALGDVTGPRSECDSRGDTKRAPHARRAAC